MMLGMSPMTSGMMGESTMQNHQVDASDHHINMLSMSEKGQTQQSANDTCDDDQNCGLCLFHCSAALIPEISVFDTSSHFTFESNYRFRDAPSSYSRLLRPPKSV